MRGLFTSDSLTTCVFMRSQNWNLLFRKTLCQDSELTT